MAEPDPQQVAALIAADPLVAYLVECLGGRVVRITPKRRKRRRRQPADKSAQKGLAA